MLVISPVMGTLAAVIAEDPATDSEITEKTGKGLVVMVQTDQEYLTWKSTS